MPFLKKDHRKLWAELYNNTLYTIEVMFKFRKQPKVERILNSYEYPNLPLAKCPDMTPEQRDRVPDVGFKL